MKKIRTELLSIIALAVVFGFVAGILAYVFIALGGNRIPLFGQINIADSGWNNQIVIDQPRSVVVEQDIRLEQIENDVWPTLVSIYYAKSSNSALSQTYVPAEVLAGGVVITADGWIISSRKALPSLIGNYEAVGYQAKKYALNKFIEDKTTGLVFGRFQAGNAPVAKLGDSNSLRVGQTLALVSKNNGLTLVNVKKIGYLFASSDDLIISSEELNKKIILNTDLSQEIDGSPLVNLKGELVGLVSGGQIVPVNYFKNIINQVLENQKIIRPILGLKYIDLAQVDGLIGRGDKGALVYGSAPRASRLYGLILDGDIIKKVDDVEINSRNSLAELINTYKSGDQLELLVQRGDQELKIETILK